MINTNLTPLDPEECKTLPKGKMVKSLQDAWKVASENHDLPHFKGILKLWQEEEAKIEQEFREEQERLAQEEEVRAAREAEEAKTAESDEAQAKKKSKSRKSKGGEGDVDMADADGQKSAKKRKKDAESDAEGQVWLHLCINLLQKDTDEFTAQEDAKGDQAQRTQDSEWRGLGQESSA